MAILNSTVGADPFPWAFSRDCQITKGDVWNRNRFAERVDAALGWFPRPEYENHPNPILIAFRAARLTQNGIATPVEWLMALQAYEGFGGYRHWELPGHPFLTLLASRDDEREHARRVLERLEALAIERETEGMKQ